ncbi:hypothetical protein [Mesobacillus harenae]|uniref:hypothetical protein n=1 Tax=Mesobacillus harenae TaxID=2213203 RepID=UPI0015801CFE|nr:hypothetical protein [Mesobacillus harenae]
MITALSACSSSGEAEPAKSQTDVEEENSESIEVDKGLLSVEVTLPASMFEGEDIESTIASAEEDGIEVTKNDDGSLTYNMSKSKHKQMLQEMETDLKTTVEEMKNSEEFTSIQNITHNNSFSEFRLVVDKAAYENSFDGFAAFGLGFSGMFYQLFDGASPDRLEVKILVEDAASGEVFNEIVYPDALEEEEG